jgi:hypothetical protein
MATELDIDAARGGSGETALSVRFARGRLRPKESPHFPSMRSILQGKSRPFSRRFQVNTKKGTGHHLGANLLILRGNGSNLWARSTLA